MEDVLDVYHRPYDPACPVVCMDESSKQQIKEVRAPIPAAPGQPERYDTEYERNGVSNLFLFFEPLRGWRHLEVTERRTAVDWAHQVRQLVDVHYPDAARITLVMDNLNTHTPASLYKAFAPAEAHRLRQRLDIHYTPKHGSWLNEHGGNRIQRPQQTMSRSAHSRPGHTPTGTCSLASRAQCRGHDHAVAFHHRRRTDQAASTLPDNTKLIMY